MSRALTPAQIAARYAGLDHLEVRVSRGRVQLRRLRHEDGQPVGDWFAAPKARAS